MTKYSSCALFFWSRGAEQQCVCGSPRESCTLGMNKSVVHFYVVVRQAFGRAGRCPFVTLLLLLLLLLLPLSFLRS